MNPTDPPGARGLRGAYPLTRIREAMRRHGGRVLDFAVGRAPERPPDWVGAFVREHASMGLRRRTAEEADAFVAAAAGMLERVYGARVSPRRVLPAPSARAAMAALAGVLIEPGDPVLVTEPGYPAFARVAAHAGARIVSVRLDPRRRFALDLDGLPGSDRGAIRLAGLNFPNNPTGAVLSPEGLADLRSVLGAGAVAFNDAMYGPFTYERPPFSFLAGDPGDVLELHSLGKLFSLGPMGIAFLAGSLEPIAAVDEYGDFVWSQISSLQIRLATRCLESWDHVQAARDATRYRLERLREAVAAAGFRPYDTPAGIYLLCPCPGSIGSSRVESAAEAAEILLRDHGLAVVPWDVPPDRYLRFVAGASDDDLEALTALASSGRLEVT